MTRRYDLIGDIHGQAGELKRLLAKLGYQLVDGVYRHDTRRVIFLGDFVDRGEFQVEVINIARSMVGAGSAMAVMGNHEFNAIAYATQDPQGGYLRKHSAKNQQQHQAFLEAYKDDPAGYDDTINWFKSLPLWLDLPDLRVIHACWDSQMIAWLEENHQGNLLTKELLYQSCIAGTTEYLAIETLLKGKEVELPEGAVFYDKMGIARNAIRVKWWEQNNTYRDSYLGPPDGIAHIPDEPINVAFQLSYGQQEKPVFIGHYWLTDTPARLAPNIACLDYSVAKAGANSKLVAYRFDGEVAIDNNKFIWADRL